MKRRSILGAAATVLTIIVLLAAIEHGTLVMKPHIRSKAAVLMDLETGKLWMDVNGGAALCPAGMSKMMTQMIVLDRLAAGVLHWSDKVPVSARAGTAEGTTLNMQAGEVYTVKELYQGVTVYSANDAAVALAEHIAGSESAFVSIMNAKAKALGLSGETVFANATGASPPSAERQQGKLVETRMTAVDAGKLAAALITSYPEVLETSSLTQMKLQSKGLYVSNTNLMLPGMGGAYAYTGTDGLKTGYDERTGYSFAGTAERGGHRVIAVIMGADSQEERFKETAELFDYAFYMELPPVRRFKYLLGRLGGAFG
ncbi:D-alanyl-D-alanine carboxypeptidase family protein [Paenibacillus sabinae]|uniref:D-alanyl-D-alanine carboxypeptidase n=1 Tax=Paenibacillus sabinae T27 TaxID=1268072 RepID=X4ZTB7_9BACL|nr:D-alanyl-D-alanine carboxypeptidase family protein [Paenibacillus sabinae]AHV99705.1 D-alanyl-D-alanine carboxypeptidase [Paenibacillus sabinae T27]